MATQFAIPLVGAAAATTSAAPVTGTINRYDATSGALTPTLPALSGVTAGASLIVQKTDSSVNTVTVTCAGADTFDDSTTTVVLKTSGDLRYLLCMSVSGTKSWKVIGTVTTTASVAPLAPTAVKTSAYTAVVNDLVPVDATSAGFTVTLPTAPVDKSRISLKKIDSTANAVTIAAGGSDVFNKTGGPTTLSMVALNQAVTLQYATSSGIWYVVVNDAPVATLDTRYLGITATAAAATKSVGQWAPPDQNFIAWSFDPAALSSTQIPTSGTVTVVGLKVPAGTITNIILNIGTAGATLTSGQCFAGLYQGGTLLAATADQAAAWVSTGVKTMALTSAQTVTAGMVYVAYFSNGTTNPAFSRGNNSTAVNAGLGAGAYRYATADTGRTTTFASTLGTLTSLNAAVWAAVS